MSFHTSLFGFTGTPRTTPEGLRVGGGAASFGNAHYCDEMVKKGYHCNLSISVSLRSIEGMIYYLGEYVRESASSPKLAGPGCPAEMPCIPIIVISPDPSGRSAGNSPGDHAPFVEVTYKGVRYLVPSTGQTIGKEAGYSSEVVTLVEQLLNLYRSSKDFPTSPFVRVRN